MQFSEFESGKTTLPFEVRCLMEIVDRIWEEARITSEVSLDLPVLIQVPVVGAGRGSRFSPSCSGDGPRSERPRIRLSTLRTIGILPMLLAGLLLSFPSGPTRRETNREWGRFPIAATSQWAAIGTEPVENPGLPNTVGSQASPARVVSVAWAGYLLPADRPEGFTDEAR